MLAYMYTNEFKTRAFRIFNSSSDLTKDVRPLIKALECNNHTIVRYILEDMLDSPILYERSKVDDEGERIILAAKNNEYQDRVDLYSRFMSLYLNSLDEKNMKLNKEYATK